MVGPDTSTRRARRKSVLFDDFARTDLLPHHRHPLYSCSLQVRYQPLPFYTPPVNPTGDAFDSEEGGPVPELAWPHLKNDRLRILPAVRRTSGFQYERCQVVYRPTICSEPPGTLRESTKPS